MHFLYFTTWLAEILRLNVAQLPFAMFFYYFFIFCEKTHLQNENISAVKQITFNNIFLLSYIKKNIL